MTQEEYKRIKSHLAVLKEVVKEYGGRNIDNIIMQLEERTKCCEAK